ncbi:HEAT repeat domain-containing protein [Scytonema tolypothrichoides VB-61278_2]|uniref:HEAT repeat domain-containing protein n=1 Tax=Scytonema tolypothrichoides VB-61278_2 TaxID=3232314 RepID=A0ABW8WHU9_9CYAN
MPDNQNQPKEFDAILGGQAPPPVESAVLGGLQGVKHRLTNPVVEVRIAALSEALNYGEAGLDVAIDALQDTAEQVQRFASRLLRQNGGVRGKQALLNHDPYLFFTTFQDWKTENFHPDIGITNPSETAYVVNFEQLKLLLQDPQACKIEALICQMWDCNHSADLFIDELCASYKQLTSLKALFIGALYEPEYLSFSLKLCNLSPIVKAFPNLEVLHVCGSKGLEFRQVKHDNLKTLILDVSNLVDDIDQLSGLNLPALEYLDLWLGNNCYDNKNTTNVLMPILSGKLFPRLRYLGLRGSQYDDKIAYAIAPSAIVNHLKVLDLSKGTLRDKGAEALLKSSAINRLHTLNVSNTAVSDVMRYS